MASWVEFSAGPAEVLQNGGRGDRGTWREYEGGAAALAAAGQRLLEAPPAGIALLATVARDGAPRVHPFMPRVVDGRLVAFILRASPKLRDLLDGRACVIHSAPAEEDEEFWVRGFGRAIEEHARIEPALGAMPWGRPESEVLVEFDLAAAGWTRWLDFGTPSHRPLHHRWRAAA